jgi:hypothetical protein
MSSNNPSYLWSVLCNKCPRCREGDLFVTSNGYALKRGRYMKMYDYCPACGQRTDIEVGFYYGTSFISYGLTVVFSGLSFVGWWLLFGFSITDNSIFWWLGVNSFVLLAMQPLFMRVSRTLWLGWFVKYDPDWKNHPAPPPERIIESEMNNW